MLRPWQTLHFHLQCVSKFADIFICICSQTWKVHLKKEGKSFGSHCVKPSKRKNWYVTRSSSSSYTFFFPPSSSFIFPTFLKIFFVPHVKLFPRLLWVSRVSLQRPFTSGWLGKLSSLLWRPKGEKMVTKHYFFTAVLLPDRPNVAWLMLSRNWELKKGCIVRESNPGRPRGRRAFYHWTNDASMLMKPF